MQRPGRSPSQNAGSCRSLLRRRGCTSRCVALVYAGMILRHTCSVKLRSGMVIGAADHSGPDPILLLVQAGRGVHILRPVRVQAFVPYGSASSAGAMPISASAKPSSVATAPNISYPDVAASALFILARNTTTYFGLRFTGE